MVGLPVEQGLYDPRNEHDACGIGFVVNIQGVQSHDIIVKGLQILINLAHRGACGCDPETGDGAGILIQIPHKFFARECAELGFTLPPAGEYGVGMVFLPVEPSHRLLAEGILERIAREEGLTRARLARHAGGCRTPSAALRALRSRTSSRFSSRGAPGMSQDELERKLYIVRKRAESEIAASDLPDKSFFYIPSLSSRTIVYKGLLLANQIAEFYNELTDPDAVSALCLVHQRFSTNTFPSWQLAHPYRYLCHNGEINTVRGNVNWMHAREKVLSSELFGDDLKKTLAGDRAGRQRFGFARQRGRVADARRPQPAARDGDADSRSLGCRHHHAAGEEGVLRISRFADGAMGRSGGDRLHRWPLHRRHARSQRTASGALSGDARRPGDPGLGSRRASGEAGGSEVQGPPAARPHAAGGHRRRPHHSRRRAQGAPVRAGKPYGEWLKANQITLDSLPEPPRVYESDLDSIVMRQRAFGYTDEDLRVLMLPMAEKGEEPIGSMGTDTPLACLSDKPQPLFHYFKQLFAQVTNPAIDPIREELVMSLTSYIGTERNILEETPQHCHTLKLPHPLLTNRDLEKLRRVSTGDLLANTLPMLFRVAGGEKELERALDGLCRRASLAVRSGYRLLILTDRGMDEEYAPIPSLLALSAVHNHLVREGTRTQVALIIESGEPREVMHFCLLIGYGASAVNPYLAIETLEDQAARGHLPAGVTFETALEELQEGHQQGPAEGLLEDGHFDAAKLSRRAGFRSHRTEQIADRAVFHRHRVAHRRRRPGRAGARSQDEARLRVPGHLGGRYRTGGRRKLSIPRARRVSSAESR